MKAALFFEYSQPVCSAFDTGAGGRDTAARLHHAAQKRKDTGHLIAAS